jgi:uncharacterized protein
MATKHPTRRQLLGHFLSPALALTATALGSGAAVASTSSAPVVGRSANAPRVLTAWNVGEQSWAGVWVPGQARRGMALPARAHHLLPLPASTHFPGDQALVMARRPGEFLLRMDTQHHRALQWHRMELDRYLGGHAVLAANGTRFFTTETDAEDGRGLVVERDLRTLEALREFPSGGIGPHALVLEANGTLLVANGGILNLPETGRRKLNLDRMDPNLSRLDPASGMLLAQYRLPDPMLSLRHLAVAPDGSIGIALQAEHANQAERHSAPALALLQGESLHAVDWTSASQIPAQWDGYAGDICFANGMFQVSAPHAGWLLAWTPLGHMATPQFLEGVGALAAKGGDWVAGGEHAVLRFSADTAQTYALPSGWDNHAALL